MYKHDIDDWILDETELAEHYKDIGKPEGYESKMELVGLLEQLKEYQQLEEQGRLIKLPCKIGDKVWHISGRAIKEDVISGIEYSYDGMFYIWSNEDTWLGGFNDIVFLTKSEAEAKLKELRGEENESSNLHT